MYTLIEFVTNIHFLKKLLQKKTFTFNEFYGLIGQQGDILQDATFKISDKTIEQQSQNSGKVIVIEWQLSGTTRCTNDNHN